MAWVVAVCGRRVLAESAEEIVSSLSLVLGRVDSVDGRGGVTTGGAGACLGGEMGAGGASLFSGTAGLGGEMGVGGAILVSGTGAGVGVGAETSYME